MDIQKSQNYYDDHRIEQEIMEAAHNCYLPTNKFLLKLIKESKGKLKLLFYISGSSIDQFMMYAPDVISSFRKLTHTGQVGFAGGTRSHSIASLTNNKTEFQRQINENRQRINYYFDQTPQIFVNSDLLFSNSICDQIAETGYDSILVNGSKKILQWRSPNYLYDSLGDKNISIFFRNETISNQFSSILKNAGKLKLKKKHDEIITSLETFDPEEPQINIYCNYFNLGGSDIEAKQSFFQNFSVKMIQNQMFQFNLPAEMHNLYGPIAEIGTESPVCWVEQFNESYYPGNELQKEAIRELFKLEKKMENITNQNLIMDWLYLQTTDHFHLMDENHPSYRSDSSDQSIFKSKYDAFINYMNILEDFRQRIKAERLIDRTNNKLSSEIKTIS